MIVIGKCRVQETHRKQTQCSMKGKLPPDMTWLSNEPNEHSLGSFPTELIDYTERNLISSQLVSLPFD